MMQINQSKQLLFREISKLYTTKSSHDTAQKLLAEYLETKELFIAFSYNKIFKTFSYPDKTADSQKLIDSLRTIKITDEYAVFARSQSNETTTPVFNFFRSDAVCMIPSLTDQVNESFLLFGLSPKDNTLDDNELHFLKTVCEMIFILSLNEMAQNEKVLLLEKQAQIAEEEKRKTVNQYIKTYNEKQELLREQKNLLEALKEKENKEINLFGKIEQLSKEIQEAEKTIATFNRKPKQSQNEELQKYVRSLSNAMRNPINALVSLRETITYGKSLNENKDKYTRQINRISNDLLIISEKLSGLVLSGKDKPKLSRKKLIPNEILKNIAEHYLQDSENSGIKFSIRYIPEEQSEAILIDKTILERTVNLILNYSREHKQTKYIHLQAEQKQNILSIMTESDATYPTEKKSPDLQNGPGETDSELSFHLIKQNVELLDGNYSMGSKQPKGMYLKINIPYISADGSKSKTESTETGSEKTTDRLHGILIAEDEEINFMLLETLLTDVFQLNPVLYHAENGKEAVELFKTEKDRIDLILMDLKMPVMDGFLATKEIRAMQTQVPIIAQTAYNSKEYKIKAAESGCNDLISKPISRNVFRDILIKHLGLELQ